LTPKASILVDADTGAVLDALNVHEPLPPASLTKIVTALTAVAVLEPHTTVAISARAAGMPAHNLNMKAGQVWSVEDILSGLLVSSANDAGMALAERVSGSAEAFKEALGATARRLGMNDRPLLQDPSGLDDEFSIGGGNRISARDLAIAARAVLTEPRLAPIVASPVVSFTGGDGIAHRLGNHNRMLKTYSGAVGMKTGYTSKSLHSLIAAATRNGRTMIAVILNSPGDTYGPAATLLDKGFATAVGLEPTADKLPPVVAVGRVAAPERTQLGSAPALTPGESAAAATPAAGGGSFLRTLIDLFLKLVLFLAVVVIALRARVRARQSRNRATRHKQYRVPPKPAVISLTSRPEQPVMSMSAPIAPAPSRPVVAERAGPRPNRPLRARPRPVRRTPAHARARVTESDTPPMIDPRLAKRFEILVRTGQVVP
jgi:D-alanyl-D-alanine carboxypeptidase (penicillin-binding protein 5/6)